MSLPLPTASAMVTLKTCCPACNPDGLTPEGGTDCGCCNGKRMVQIVFSAWWVMGIGLAVTLVGAWMGHSLLCA